MAKAKKVIHPVPAHPKEVEIAAVEVSLPPTPVEHPAIASLRKDYASLSQGEKGGQKGKFLQFQFLKATKALRVDVAPLTL